jgi:hypothetical protein
MGVGGKSFLARQTSAACSCNFLEASLSLLYGGMACLFRVQSKRKMIEIPVKRKFRILNIFIMQNHKLKNIHSRIPTFLRNAR